MTNAHRVGSLLAAALLAALAGCGHPATEADCQLIADRIAELELKAQNITDPAEVRRKKDETLGLGGATSSKKELLEGCIGRHVTDKALACVRQAKTSDEIASQCLR
jgi:hypothetical protein